MENCEPKYLILVCISSYYTYNHFHNTLRLFDVLPNFHFTRSETVRDYYLQTEYIRVPEGLKTWNLRKLENIRKVSKLHIMIA